MFNFKKTALVLAGLISVVSFNANAQTEENSVAARDKLIQKYKNTKPFMVMFYNGKNLDLDMNKTFSKYLPYANYLSEKFDRLVVFDVDTSPANLTPSVLQTADLVYTSPLMLETLAKDGWKPLVTRNNFPSPSFVVRSSDNINSIVDLKGKTILSAQGLVNNYALFDLISSGVFKNKEDSKKLFKVRSSIDSQVLLKEISDKNFDALVLRDKDAKKLIGGNDKFKIIKSNISGPDLVVYYNPKNTGVDYTKIKNVFLSMNEDNLQAKEALVTAREYTPGENNQFTELSTQSKEFIAKVIAETYN